MDPGNRKTLRCHGVKIIATANSINPAGYSDLMPATIPI